ncbi:adenosine deaminase family protein [Actinomycetospora sp. NBRC 106378]|uniref:adenosine deaminase family protein n=1 Tax=Actinomycetospora sp. NBRC 106378 TaxID=3032208 RepID=UPI0024A231AC|nr:adenosine deaminase family protein [Actinomycetospora sp. NBRC 106378]GLZ55207.1 putative adenosine/adenine deaminase [Actinomycetospora sp. NBRC 106378]
MTPLLPKAHLHLHLMGSIRPSTYAELGGEAAFPERYGSWEEFVAAYRATKDVLRRPDDLHRLVVELVADSAADGAVWTEVSISPSGRHRALTGSDEATMEIVCDAVTAAGAPGGVVVGIDRERDAADPDRMALLAAAWAGRGVVGLGIAGDETAPIAPFGRAAEVAHDAGLLVVPHSGELCGPESIREDLRVVRPDRLMHGVRAVEDPELVRELADRGITLDVGISSNVALGVVPDLASHPLPDLVRAGVPCSVNADDTLLFGTGLAHEYELARRLGLTDAELAAVARASVVGSAAPASVREVLRP